MAFLAPVGVALAGLFGTTGVAATTGALLMTAGGIGAGASMLAGPGKSSSPSVSMPSAPESYASSFAAEQAKLLKATQAQTKSILTSPLGVTGDSKNVQRKLLLGS